MNRNLLLGLGAVAAVGAAYWYFRRGQRDAAMQSFEAPSLPMPEDLPTPQPTVVTTEPLQQPTHTAVPLKVPSLAQQAVTVEKSTAPVVSLEKSLTAFPAMGYLNA